MDKQAEGKVFRPYEFLVERGKIREFADALEDLNPIYRDPAHAASTPFGGIPAPRTFLRTMLYENRDAVEALKVKDWSYIVHGEQEFEYLAPIRAGDVLTGRDRIAKIFQKESRRAGTLTFAVIESTFHNQRGEKVQVARRTLIETGQRIQEPAGEPGAKSE
ncbi:MAG: MaoC family dehydratase N-terminal domain-containing protein [Candidatus Tectomicrobia bacterium]|nr:MaoC family dehydratase N-terminal domain-containing protein [Candidatus Tectomicrobia bacterium]